MVFDGFLNSIFGGFIAWNPLVALIVISFVLMLITTLIYKYFTDQEAMKNLKDEMKEIVENATRVSEALGSFRITATESDEKKKEFRRSIVLTREMKQGEVIKEEDIDYKRPGGGFDPGMTNFLVGRTVSKDLKFDHILTNEDIV